MELDEIIKIVCEESSLKEDDYFDTPAFYYLAGRFPELAIKQCVEIIDRIRNKYM